LRDKPRMMLGGGWEKILFRGGVLGMGYYSKRDTRITRCRQVLKLV
jgi:hypothetical protein